MFQILPKQLTVATNKQNFRNIVSFKDKLNPSQYQ